MASSTGGRGTGQLGLTSRRTLLKGAGVAAGAAVFAPALLRPARAASELRIFSWAGYLKDDLLKAFEAKTGITPVRTEFGTNDELLNQLKATQGSGFDIVWPTVDRVPNYVELELIQPIDESKVHWDGVVKSILDGSGSIGAIVGGKRYQVPTDWGTEAIAFNSNDAKLEYGKASYGDLWRDDFAGKVTVRGHTALVGIGLWLEAEGKLPHPMRDSFKDEATMVANYDVIIKTAIANKKKVGQFWTNENEAQGAFRTNGCVIGQNWDTTAAALAKDGAPVRYVAPKEGALAWLEGISIPRGASNLDNAYAFINWLLTPEGGAMFANANGFNTATAGVEPLLSPEKKAFFAQSYPGDALDKLWWWPIQDNWFVSKRNEYQDRFLSA
ncbi:extracellular solute-binding protein [Chelatococcus sp. GCM10030263]|uniref:extracellular solute-binding protein n=1 Tax=Chelatococcus sp. GCM10030263 TaxID=3273387 RepID=UPI00361C416C